MFSLFSFILLDNQPYLVQHGVFVKLQNSNTWTFLSIDQQLSHPRNILKNSTIYTSSLEFDQEWNWDINAVNPTVSYNGEPIPCGSLIRISSTKSKTQLGIKKSIRGYVISPYFNDVSPFTAWNITCDSGSYWAKDIKVQFYNKEGNCFLSTSKRYPLSLSMPTKFPVKCTKSTINSVWEVHEGIYTSDDN